MSFDYQEERLVSFGLPDKNTTYEPLDLVSEKQLREQIAKEIEAKMGLSYCGCGDCKEVDETYQEAARIARGHDAIIRR